MAAASVAPTSFTTSPAPAFQVSPVASSAVSPTASAETPPATSAQGPGMRRIALLVGANQGGGDRVRLRYATRDAETLSRVLHELGGVQPEDTELLREPSRAAFLGALTRLRARLAAARTGADRVELVFYYSGHSDDDGLLLSGERVPYATLRGLIDALPADVRLVIVDSCSSGALTRTKGGVRRPAFLIDASQRVEGRVVLTSSSENEAAQESDSIQSSFFTHFLVSGLRGAADVTRDGRVSLTEAYQFAFAETLQRTERTSAGGQHPAYAMDLAGTGDLILTDLRTSSATLVLPEELSGRVYVRDAEGVLVAEMKKPAGRAVELGVPAGRYRVLVEKGGALSAGELELAVGARVSLANVALSPVQGERTVRRGPSEQDTKTAEAVYARERLRVEARPYPGAFVVGPFVPLVGASTLPIQFGDFYDRAGRPDLRARYDEAVATKDLLTYGGLAGELGLAALGIGVFTLVFLLPVTALEAAFAAILLVSGSAMGLAIVSGVVSIVGSFLEPNPIGLDEARAVAADHNAALRRRLGLPAEATAAKRRAP